MNHSSLSDPQQFRGHTRVDTKINTAHYCINLQPEKQNCSDTPVDYVKLSTIEQQLDTAVQRSLAQYSRLQKAMDFVLGECPMPGNDKGVPSPSGGVMGEIRMRFAHLFALQTQIDEEILRLEQVVG